MLFRSAPKWRNCLSIGHPGLGVQESITGLALLGMDLPLGDASQCGHLLTDDNRIHKYIELSSDVALAVD